MLLADPEIELIGIPEKTADGELMDELAYNAVVETLNTLPKPRRRDPDAVGKRSAAACGRRSRSIGGKSRTSRCMC